MDIPLEEMLVDLANTESDIQALSSIVGALDVLITRHGGEDRSSCKRDLLKYSSLLATARDLSEKIQSAIASKKP